MNISDLATDKFRWYALVVIAISLAIVIIDNTVLNVAIPYILRDLHTTFDSIQWVVSGYALIIATLLITAGRLGDMFGRKKVFVIGIMLFAVGSFVASISQNAPQLFIGEALIEAMGASFMLTSSLSLLVSEFHGKERAIAFGIWGSVAGASATIGPLLGGYLTTYYSWRWSLRINVLVAIIAVLGSVFIKESKGEGGKKFDFLGTVFSGIGLFSLIFGFIEGRKFGWWAPNESFTLGDWHWPFQTISVIPYAFWLAFVFLALFVITEYLLEKKGESPILSLHLFNNRAFSLGLAALGIISLGQFGAFFVLPIFLQNALGLNALQTGLVFLSTSIAIGIFGPLSGFVASRIGPKWIVTIGMFATSVGLFFVTQSLSLTSTGWTLAPSLALFGIGIGMSSAQITNIILSSVKPQFAGEASATNATVRQVGTSIGIALIGMVLASSLTTNMTSNIRSDSAIPAAPKETIISNLQNISVESGQKGTGELTRYPLVETAVNRDINNALVDSSKNALQIGFYAALLGALLSLFIPNVKVKSPQELAKETA